MSRVLRIKLTLVSISILFFSGFIPNKKQNKEQKNIKVNSFFKRAPAMKANNINKQLYKTLLNRTNKIEYQFLITDWKKEE